ncbi:MAG: hypothetical protein ACEQR8_10085 [Cypionkella sp.]
MSFWTAAVIIVAIVSVTEIIKAKYRARHGIVTDSEGNESAPQRSDPAIEREVEQLRERIKVLERIATDGNTAQALETRRVADEIEALRDR